MDDLEDRFDELNRALRQRLTRLLRHRKRFQASTIAGWLDAKRTLAESPILEVRVDESLVEVVADVVGLDVATLELEVTSRAFVLVSSAREERTVRFSVQLPIAVDPDTAQLGFDDGLLIVRATRSMRERLTVRRWIDDGLVPGLANVGRGMPLPSA